MTKKITSTYKTFDIVVVPFPFVDSMKTKNRPALVISAGKYFNAVSGHTVLAMITSAKHSSWKSDSSIKDLASCGLLKPSLIRYKLFTIDNRLIKDKIGKLSVKDQRTVQEKFFSVFADVIETAHN